MTIALQIASGLLATVRDIAPIAAVLIAFQVAVIRRFPANFRAILIGLAHVVFGLTLFRVGLEASIIPVGKDMAAHLAGLVVRGRDAQRRHRPKDGSGPTSR